MLWDWPNELAQLLQIVVATKRLAIIVLWQSVLKYRHSLLAYLSRSVRVLDLIVHSQYLLNNLNRHKVLNWIKALVAVHRQTVNLLSSQELSQLATFLKT